MQECPPVQDHQLVIMAIRCLLPTVSHEEIYVLQPSVDYKVIENFLHAIQSNTVQAVVQAVYYL